MIRLFLWLMVCVNGECNCERVEYTRDDNKTLSVHSKTINVDLERVPSSLQSPYYLYKQDSTLYVVSELVDYRDGMYLVLYKLESYNVLEKPQPTKIYILSTQQKCLQN